jgi:hypothetical protein
MLFRKAKPAIAQAPKPISVPTKEPMANIFTKIFHGLHSGLVWVEKEIPSIEKAAPIVEGVTSLIPNVGAGIAMIEQTAFGLLDKVGATVMSVDSATLANGVNVPLDAAAAAEVKALIDAFSSIKLGDMLKSINTPAPVVPAAPATPAA